MSNFYFFYFIDAFNLLEYTKNTLQIQTELSIKQPTTEDLKGAANGLVRLQRTYNLKTEDVANGKFLATESR